MSKERGCESCGIQLSLKENFNRYTGGVVAEVEGLEFERTHCVNCADNSFAKNHNWKAITKAQRKMLIKRYAPKEQQKKLLANLEKPSKEE